MSGCWMIPEDQAREIGGFMRLFVSGSAPLAAQVLEEFRVRFGHTILERYGMSETLMNISNPYVGERRPGSVGLPLPGRFREVGGWRALPEGSERLRRLLAPRRGHARRFRGRLVPHRGPRRACSPTATTRSADASSDLIISGRLQHLSARDRGVPPGAGGGGGSRGGGRARSACAARCRWRTWC